MRSISVCLYGGLGNQMFQYSYGMILADHINLPLIIDDSYFNHQPKKDTKRAIEIEQFNIYFERLSNSSEKKIYKKIRFFYNIPFLGNFLGGFYSYLVHYSNISKSSFEKIPKTGKLFLNDYFQKVDFIESHRNSLRKLFVPKAEIINFCKTLDCYDFIKNNNNVVSIHVRRGDYLSNKSALKFHGVLEKSYYLDAIEYIKSMVKNPKFIFFSDDIHWVKNEFLDFSSDSFFVGDQTKKYSSVDIYLMSLCSHNIIANSTFSWWGAWLNSNPNNVTIAPNKWFVGHENKDLKVSTWVYI